MGIIILKCKNKQVIINNNAINFLPFIHRNENKKIISTAYDLLNDDGYAIFSVMNYETTIANAKNVFSFAISLKISNFTAKTRIYGKIHIARPHSLEEQEPEPRSTNLPYNG